MIKNKNRQLRIEIDNWELKIDNWEKKIIIENKNR